MDNYVLEKLDHGMSTNSWEKLVRRTSFLFKWYAMKTCFMDLVCSECCVDLSEEAAATVGIPVAKTNPVICPVAKGPLQNGSAG